MITRYESPIVEIVCRVIVPFVQVFALYVITHGHYGPGGGFQGGVILAASFILLRLSLGRELAHQKLPPRLAIGLGAFGVLLYGLTGLVPLFSGGQYLDYGHLPIPGVSGAELRYLGILIVEIGIAFGVMGIMVGIFDNLVERQP